MVDVREIAARARDLKELDELIFQFMPLSSAQAVTVRVLPWLFLDERSYRWMEETIDYWRYFFGHPTRASRVFTPWLYDDLFKVPGRVLANLDWDTIQGRFFKSSITQDIAGKKPRDPFHIELHVRQDAYDPDQVEFVERLAAESPLFVTVARRGTMQLQFASGDRVLSGAKRGTIGGLITDSGTVFGVSCSHFASSGSVTDLSGTTVGNVRAATTQTSMATGSVCHPRPRPGSAACAINSLDLALVEMSVAVPATGLTLAGSVAQGDSVDVSANGKSYSFGVRSMAIAMQLGLGGTDFCYSPLIELYPVSGTTTRSGDSGAWGLANRSSEWATVVVGSDGISSFAMDARDAADWIDKSGVVSAGGWSVY